MKKLLFIFIFINSFLCLKAQETVINGCYITVYHTWDRGSSTSFWAYGDVFVETYPKQPIDLYVKIVNTEDESTYRVFKTIDTPKECGEWRFVTDRDKAKFTIHYVKEREDCSIF